MLWFWALLLLVVLVVAWATNVVGLPGNWLALAAAALYAWLVPDEPAVIWDVGLAALVVLLGLAVVGELIEFAAGSAGAASAGGSKRGAALAIVGALVGGIVGLFVGLPIPVLGAVVASMLFSALGAMIGAILGEQWKGRQFGESFWVGHGAFWGRLLGTLGKIAVGFLMIVVVALALLVRWA